MQYGGGVGKRQVERSATPPSPSPHSPFLLLMHKIIQFRAAEIAGKGQRDFLALGHHKKLAKSAAVPGMDHAFPVHEYALSLSLFPFAAIPIHSGLLFKAPPHHTHTAWLVSLKEGRITFKGCCRPSQALLASNQPKVYFIYHTSTSKVATQILQYISISVLLQSARVLSSATSSSQEHKSALWSACPHYIYHISYTYFSLAFTSEANRGESTKRRLTSGNASDTAQHATYTYMFADGPSTEWRSLADGCTAPKRTNVQR